LTDSIAEQAKLLLNRQIPPELGALAEDDADTAGHGDAAVMWNMVLDPYLATGGDEDTGEQLDGGRLASAIRADVTNHFAWLDRKVDGIKGDLLLVVGPNDVAERAGEAGLLERALKALGQGVGRNDRQLLTSFSGGVARVTQ
jgi:hypothetical protein